MRWLSQKLDIDFNLIILRVHEKKVLFFLLRYRFLKTDMKLLYRVQESENECTWERSVEVPVYTSEARESLVFSARAPLSQHYEPDTATLHALALFIATHD